MHFLTEDQIFSFSENGYLSIPAWLSTNNLQKINQEFEILLAKNAFRKAEVTHGGRNLIRGDWTYWLNDDTPENLQKVHQTLQSWIKPMNENFYCGVTRLEAHLAQYPIGSGYERHLDCAQNNFSRKVSFVLYLNQNWSADMGGELRIFHPHEERILFDLSPRPGTLFLFRSELFPHEVLPSRQVRRSLTGWFRNDAV